MGHFLLTWDYVRDRLLAEYERTSKGGQEKKDEKGPGNPQDALFRGGNGYKKFNKSNKFENKNNKNENNTDQATFKFTCHYCHEPGHKIRDCQKKRRAYVHGLV